MLSLKNVLDLSLFELTQEVVENGKMPIRPIESLFAVIKIVVNIENLMLC